jgi:hypothetical protein
LGVKVLENLSSISGGAPSGLLRVARTQIRAAYSRSSNLEGSSSLRSLISSSLIPAIRPNRSWANCHHEHSLAKVVTSMMRSLKAAVMARKR